MLPENTKHEEFACIAMPGGLADYSGLPLDIDDSLTISAEAPVTIDDWWRQQLGQFLAERFDDSRLFLVARAPFRVPSASNIQKQNLEQAVLALMYSLLMHDLRCEGRAVVVAASASQGKTVIRELETLHTHYNCPNSFRCIKLEEVPLAGAAALALKEVLDQPGNYPRFRRGVNAWIRGLLAEQVLDRLHQFTRSLDALMIPPIGRSRAQFARRGQLFLGAGPDKRKLLEEVYDLRSCAEHMNDYTGALTAYSPGDHDRIGCLRVFQVETLAKRVYSLVLRNRSLLEIFTDDGRTHQFWNLPDDQKQKRWGPPLDMAAEEQFFLYQ